MAESKGCAKAFRRVTRGALQSTCSPGCELSNMRDWVATLGSYSTRAEMNKKFEKRNSKFARGATTDEFRVLNFEFRGYPLLLGSAGFGSGVGVFFGEALNAAGGVHQLLLASEEGVAIRADFHAQHVALYGRARLKRVAAGAVHRHGVIIGMNTGFHGAAFRRVRSARPTRQSQGIQPRR